MPSLSIAVMLLMVSLPFLFTYISFNLWNKYTALGVFFLLLSLGFVIASLGIATNFMDSDPQVQVLLTNLTYVIVLAIAITLVTITLDVLPLMLKKFSEGKH